MPQPTRFPTLRVAGRLANAFVLDLVRLGGNGRDVIDALLKMAIVQANVAQVMRDPQLQRAYATLEHPVPNELRRPVSINAVASSLQLPFETTRRRIRALAEAGQCELTARGVIVPLSPIDAKMAQIGAEIPYSLVRQLYRRLRAIGLLQAPTPTEPWDMSHPPYRLVLRLAFAYVLRLCEPLATNIGDPVSGIIAMDIVRANTEHLSDAEGGTDDPNVGGFPEDSLRRPVRVATLSERLGIPQETVRRHVNRLVNSRRCVRVGQGYVVTSAILANGSLTRFMLDNQIHLSRLFSALDEFGILAAWEREPLQVRGAA